MLLSLLLLIPLIGIFMISSLDFSHAEYSLSSCFARSVRKNNKSTLAYSSQRTKQSKIIALTTSIINLFISFVIFILFNFSTNQFQFVQEYHKINSFDFYLGIDGISIYFVLLTTIILPISLLSNWNSISENIKSYLIIILLLETLLLAVFLVLDILLFYIFLKVYCLPYFY